MMMLCLEHREDGGGYLALAGVYFARGGVALRDSMGVGAEVSCKRECLEARLKMISLTGNDRGTM